MKYNNNYSTFSMSTPIIFQSFFQILFGLVDTWFLSLYTDNAVASVGYANQIISVILLAYVVLSSSVSIVGAQYLGEKRIKDTYMLSSDSVISTIIISMFITVVLLMNNNLILEFLNVPNNIKEGTQTYFIVISIGLVFQGGITVFTSIYRIFAKAQYAMYVGIFTNVLNIVGDAIVIFNPLGYKYDYILGVAITTVSSNVFGFLLLYCSSSYMLGLRYKLSISFENIRLLMRYGIPAAGENISYKISQLVVTVLITSLGSYVLTAKIYAMNIMLFASLIPNSIGVATGIIIGYLFGEKKYEILYRRCYKNIKIGIFFVIILDIIIVTMSDSILNLFTQNPEIIKNAKYIIYLEAAILFFKVGNFMFGNSLKGIGDVYYCVILGVISMWTFGVGLAYILGIVMGFGVIGIYVAFGVDELFRGIVMWRRWIKKTNFYTCS